MKLFPLVTSALAGAALLLAGCSTTRSISNSHVPGGHSQLGGYTGELSELEVIGVTADSAVTEADIQAAVLSAGGTKLSRTSKVLLIQSGADFPDAPMLEAMQARFHVASFSGRPTAKAVNAPAYAKTLRLVAARGGYDKIVCYWGVLESAKEDQITRTISWVPIVGNMIPDEIQHMRIKLKAAIIDVPTGRWSFVNPPSATSSQLTARFLRQRTDQDLVHKLKAEGYQTLARTLTESHTE